MRTLIRGGTVVDGTGAAARSADVLIEDGRIAQVGRVDPGGARVVDADGLLVTPGWVDVHTHYDGQVYWDPLMTPSSWNGATSVVMGNCGVGFAPVRPDQHDALMDLMTQIEDIPGETLRAGIPWGWETFREYLDCLDATPRAIDVGAFVPHGAVRTYVMGERGERGEASAEEIEEIARIVDDAMLAGALGCSANRSLAKNAVVPGSFAKDEELLALARVVGARGGLFQTAPGAYYGTDDDDWTTAEFETDLIRRMSLEGGCPITFNLVQFHPDPDRWRRILSWIDAANAEGANLFAQVLARPLNAVLSLQTHHFFQQLPAFGEISAGLSVPELAARMGEPGVRERVLEQAKAIPATMFDDLYRVSDPPDYEPPPEQSISALARSQGVQPMERFYDELRRDEGSGMFLYIAANYGGGSADVVLEMIRHPATVLGAGDGGAHCLGLCDATTPTTLLTHWVRDRTRGPRLELETAVHELTQRPARYFGLADRGSLEPGMRADLNLIDLPNLSLGGYEIVADLPAGGRRIVQRTRGYAATWVAGECVLEDGSDTGARPGRTLRGRAYHDA